MPTVEKELSVVKSRTLFKGSFLRRVLPNKVSIQRTILVGERDK